MRTIGRALVIGGTGFIGLNLVDALLGEGVETRVTWRKRSITVFVGKRDVELVPGDLTDSASLRTAMAGCDTVFLAGAHYPRYSLQRSATLERAVQDIENTCQAARDVGVERVVYTSSIASLSTVAGRPVNEDDIPAEIPVESVYRAAKWAMEREVERQIDAGLDVVTMLPGGCLGPFDARVGTSGLLVGFIANALPWWVDGVVNLADVRDVASAHVNAARIAKPGERFCVGGHSRMLREVFEFVRTNFGGTFPPEIEVPEARQRATAEEEMAAERKQRAAFPRELVDIIAWGQRVDSQRAATALSITPRPLETTLRDAHDWFRRFGYLSSPSPQPRKQP